MKDPLLGNSLSDQPTYAAFDFDGTMTYRDSLLAFLYFLEGSYTYLKLAAELPQFIGYLGGTQSRQDIKELILTKFFAGVPYEELVEKGAFFARSSPNLIRPKALKRLEWHQCRGDTCILVSANLDVYLKGWAKEMGFSHAITSQCAIDNCGLLTGKLQQANCRGPEKVRRLHAFLGSRENYQLYAYGDSAGDQELLRYADYSFYRYFE